MMAMQISITPMAGERTAATVLADAVLGGGLFVVWLNPASETEVLIDGVEFVGPRRVFEYETVLITVLAVVEAFLV